MKIFVTGAGGFVGRTLCRRLAKEGHDVTALVRRLSDEIPPPNITSIVGDVMRRESYERQLCGQDVIVHLAARAHIRDIAKTTDALAEFRRINCEATLQLANASAVAGVSKFVFLSSIGVNGNVSGNTPYTELSTPNPTQPYSISKREAELGLEQISLATGIRIVTVRPPLVYGREAPGNMRRLLGLVAKLPVLPLGSANSEKSFVSIENLVDFIKNTLDRTFVANQLFLVADDQTITVRTMVSAMAQGMRRKVLLVPMHRAAISLARHVPQTRGIATQLFSPLLVDNTHAKNAVSWSPSGTTLAGIHAMASAYAHNPW